MDITFVIVEPAVPGNIGAAARAIKTMGFNELRLVNPTDHMQEEALWLAHASQDILKSAQVYNTFENAVVDTDFRIAATARRRSVKADYYSVTELAEILEKKESAIKKAAVVFGKEESGLNNETINQCDIAVFVPMKTEYPSLNLSQAVMIFAWELSKLKMKLHPDENHETSSFLYSTFRNKIETTLNDLTINQNPSLYSRILERSAILSEKDMKLIMSVINRMKKG